MAVPEAVARPVAEGAVADGLRTLLEHGDDQPGAQFPHGSPPGRRDRVSPGQTGPWPIVRPDEEPLEEPGAEVRRGAQTTASVPFGAGEESAAA